MRKGLLQARVHGERGLGRVDQRHEAVGCGGFTQSRHKPCVLRVRTVMRRDLSWTHAAEMQVGEEAQHRCRRRDVGIGDDFGPGTGCGGGTHRALQRRHIVVLEREAAAGRGAELAQRRGQRRARLVADEPYRSRLVG